MHQIRDIDVVVDAATWPAVRPCPSWLTTGGTQKVDLTFALLLLGNVTTPHALSPASPERFWAFLRYFSAASSTSDLRIQAAFLELDPHQKSILSDDFGVAIATQWLSDRLGGLAHIVDGRRFVINCGVTPSTTTPLKKVGLQKCPDFVLMDRNGKLHVLECKGTQTGRASRDRAMKVGTDQKVGITVAKTLAGERLVIGLSLVGEGPKKSTELRVIDPESPPICTLGDGDGPRARAILKRLSLAKALNLVGLPQTAFEVSWPAGLKKTAANAPFLSKSEKQVLSQSAGGRIDRARTEIQAELARRSNSIDDFVSEAAFDLPPFRIGTAGRTVSRVRARRGIAIDVVRGLLESGPDLRAAADQQASSWNDASPLIRLTANEDGARLEQGKFFCEISFE